jgi:cytochrome oxidase Cu insertion factor (SCO1/SenC/PrrC family)
MGKRSLVLVALVCALPVVASYFMFYIWKPSSFTNYGELLEVKPLPDAQLRTLDGAGFALPDLRGKWVVLAVDSGDCDANCREKLFKIRQLRLMQGKDMDRIERVWLIPDGARPDADLTRLHSGTWFVDARGSELPARLPAQGSPRDHIYLIDPLGNLMMRYPRDADPSEMKKDFIRLLKVSRVG